MRRAILGLSIVLGIATAAPAPAQQFGTSQHFGNWTLLPLGDSCVLSIAEGAQELQLDARRTGGGVTLSSPLLSGLVVDSAPSVTLDLGAAGKATLKGQVRSIGGQITVLVGLKMDVLLPLLRALPRLSAKIADMPAFSLALPADSAAAYDAFAKCSAALPAKAP